LSERVIRLATADDDLTAAGALTAEAFRADGLLDDGDAYLSELRDAARRAREARLLVALVPADGPVEDGRDGIDSGAGVRGGTGVPEGGAGVPDGGAGAPDGGAGAPDGGAGAPDGGAGVPDGGAASPSTRMALVGTVTVAPAGSPYADIAGPGEVEVRMLAVAPRARRRGIAEALTRAAMLDAAGLGAERVVLSTTDAMTTAHRLYARLGFVSRPERDWHYGSLALRVYTWDVPRGPGARVESAVWHPREVRHVGGWRVGLSGGFTRRANSVLALAEPDDVTESIDEVERIYAAVGQPAIFRVCGQSRPDDLDDLLDARGYSDVSHTVVMVRETLDGLPAVDVMDFVRDADDADDADDANDANGLDRSDDAEGLDRSDDADGSDGSGESDDSDDASGSDFADGSDASDASDGALNLDAEVEIGKSSDASPDGFAYVVTDEPDEAWLAAWLATKAQEPVDHSLAASVLSGGRAIYVRAQDAGTGATVGVIRAALEQEWVGLSCLVVRPDARRRGVGRALTLGALRLAAARGAQRAFLQVVDSNEAAIALYGQLGFGPAERYHYRQR
jgi:ribosomal protein S18 acetylase RimI-like enzyme